MQVMAIMTEDLCFSSVPRLYVRLICAIIIPAVRILKRIPIFKLTQSWDFYSGIQFFATAFV